MFCTACGTNNKENEKICQACGSPLEMGIDAHLVASVGQPRTSGDVFDLGSPELIFRYAGFWKRFGANFIDSVMLSIVGGCLGGSVGAFIGVSAFIAQVNIDRLDSGLKLIGYLIGLVLGILYYGLMESSAMQATLGKRIFNIRVTDLQGGRISFGRAVGRFLASGLSGIIFGFGYLFMLFTERKQNLHDLIAGTLVLEK